jgi:serine/threonine protein kinase
MDTSSFSDIQQSFPDAELLPVGGSTCDCYRVRLYGKLHFLKRLKPELRTDPRYVSALQKEFETGYRLDHPHLVRYISKGDDYLLTEYVDGETLAQFAANHPEYFKSRKQTDRFLSQLLDVVGYLHQHQIVHLDLKPENILITRIGHEVKLTDLGYCYADAYTDTMGHTDKYAAPEQLNGSSIVDARTDIYAIGKILQNLPNSHIYNKVIARCTATDPSNRYQSIEELQSALKRTVPRMSLLLLMVVAIGLMTALFLFFQKPTKATTVIDETLSEQPTDSASHSHKPDTVANFHKTVVTSSPEQTPIVPKQIPQQQSALRELTDSEKAEIRRITLDILHPIYQRRVEPLVKSIIQGNFDDRKHSYSQISDTITKICIEADQEVYAGLRKVDINGMYPEVPEVDVNTVFLHAIGEAEHYYSQLAFRHFYPKTKLPPDPFTE